jgi:hypothetical protein
VFLFSNYVSVFAFVAIQFIWQRQSLSVMRLNAEHVTDLISLEKAALGQGLIMEAVDGL